MSLPGSKRIAVIRCGGLLNQHHVSTLLSYLQDCGYVLTLYAIQCPTEDIEAFRSQYPEIFVTDVGRFGNTGVSRFIRGGIALGNHLLGADAAIHYIIDSWSLRYYTVARALTSSRKPQTLIYHTFDMLSPGIAAWYERLLEKYWARNADLVVVTDPSRSALMKTLYRLSSLPIALAVRMPRSFKSPNRDEVKNFRSSLLQRGLKKLVISPTRLSSDRMGIEIIEAFAKTPEDYALIAYEGSNAYTQACRQAATKLGIERRVLIMPEASNAEVMLATAASDVALIYHNETASLGNFFCHPSRLAYCAAMGIPVIANEVPSIEAVVYRYGLGACVKLTDKHRFAESIINICSDEEHQAKQKSAIGEKFRADLCFESEGIKLKEAMAALNKAVYDPG